MAYLEITQLDKHYDRFQALKQINLSVEKEEFIVFVGPSGCGKTTLLRTISGLETPTVGQITLDGRDITYVHPSKRKWRLFFKTYALSRNWAYLKTLGLGCRLIGCPSKRLRNEC